MTHSFGKCGEEISALGVHPMDGLLEDLQMVAQQRLARPLLFQLGPHMIGVLGGSHLGELTHKHLLGEL